MIWMLVLGMALGVGGTIGAQKLLKAGEAKVADGLASAADAVKKASGS